MAFQRRKSAAAGVKAPYPGFIEPALATSIDKVPKGERWIHEIKFDGYRVQMHLANETTTVFTRNGIDWTRRFKKIAGDAFLINAASATIDGEVVVPAADGATDFSVLQNQLRGKSTSIVMVAFDLLYLNGYDLRKLPLEERKSHLKTLIAKTTIQFSESFDVDGPEMYQHACSIGLEGVVSKVRDSRYPSGRGNDWIKKTCAQRETLPIAGFALKANKFDGIYLGRLNGKDLVYAGKVDRGFDKASTADLQDRLKPLIRKTQPIREEDRASRRLGRTVATGRDRVPRQVGRGQGAASVLQGNPGGFVMTDKDVFDQWWEWATRATDHRTIAAAIHNAVMMLTPEERKNRAIVNETVRTQMSPRRPARSADRYGVPLADEDAPAPVARKSGA